VPPAEAASASAEAATASSAPAEAETAPSAPAEAVPVPSAPAAAAPVPSAPAEAPTDAAPADAAPADGAQAPGADADPSATVLDRWDGILEVVKQGSRRCHAVFEPATPLRVRNRILTLRYPKRYASFHAANATKGEYATALTEAVERSTGLKVRVDVVIEGDDDRRRPQPPSVTPADARVPALDDDPTPDEVADVREAEGVAPVVPDAAATDALLADELGAELLEHRPPPTED
jgi:DNA polymerase III subunit gamma/tau